MYEDLGPTFSILRYTEKPHLASPLGQTGLHKMSLGGTTHVSSSR